MRRATSVDRSTLVSDARGPVDEERANSLGTLDVRARDQAPAQARVLKLDILRSIDENAQRIAKGSTIVARLEHRQSRMCAACQYSGTM